MKGLFICCLLIVSVFSLAQGKTCGMELSRNNYALLNRQYSIDSVYERLISEKAIIDSGFVYISEHQYSEGILNMLIGETYDLAKSRIYNIQGKLLFKDTLDHHAGLFHYGCGIVQKDKKMGHGYLYSRYRALAD